MKESKTATMVAAVTTTAAAIIWGIVCIVDFIYGETGTSLCILHIVCELIWCIVAAKWCYKYHQIKKEDNNK